jgi:phospholipase/carboxylesterase
MAMRSSSSEAGVPIVKLSGPRLPPKSGPAKRLVVFLHGYGATGEDLISIGRSWRDWMPDAAFVAPNAPELCAQAPGARQWFPLTTRDAGERWRGAVSAHPTLDAFLDSELASAGLDDTRLAIVGFSQGAMMALHTGLRRKAAPAAILAYSGVLIGEGHLDEAIARGPTGAPPPILLIHGDRDDVVPIDGLFRSADALAKANIPVQWRISPGLGHGIDQDGLIQGGLFLLQCFGLRPPTQASAGAV